MKKKLLLLPIIVFTCCKYSTQEISVIDVKTATKAFMETMEIKAEREGNYIIYPEYNRELADSDFIILITVIICVIKNNNYLC
jgi:hypothetical protein